MYNLAGRRSSTAAPKRGGCVLRAGYQPASSVQLPAGTTSSTTPRLITFAQRQVAVGRKQRARLGRGLLDGRYFTPGTPATGLRSTSMSAGMLCGLRRVHEPANASNESAPKVRTRHYCSRVMTPVNYWRWHGMHECIARKSQSRIGIAPALTGARCSPAYEATGAFVPHRAGICRSRASQQHASCHATRARAVRAPYPVALALPVGLARGWPVRGLPRVGGWGRAALTSAVAPGPAGRLMVSAPRVSAVGPRVC